MLTEPCFPLCSDYRLHQRGDEKGQPLRAGHDQHHLDQLDELRGVEQEGRAGDRTSHQTLEGTTHTVTSGESENKDLCSHGFFYFCFGK